LYAFYGYSAVVSRWVVGNALISVLKGLSHENIFFTAVRYLKIHKITSTLLEKTYLILQAVLWIRILLFSSVTFKMQQQYIFSCKLLCFLHEGIFTSFFEVKKP